MESTTFVYDYYDGSENYRGTTDYEPCDLSPNPEEVLALTYVHSIICAFGLIDNALVMITFMFYKKIKTMTDIYLFNMCLVDLIFALSLPFITYNEQNSWVMGDATCKLLRSAYSINLYCGMLLLACISGDRYVSVVLPRRAFGSRSHMLTYSRLICLAVWVFAMALTLPTLIYTKSLEEFTLRPNSVTVTCQLHFSDSKMAKLVKILVPSSQMVVGFLVPLCVMVFCYSSIVCRMMRAHCSQRHKAMRVVLAVVVVFLVCHLPYNITLLIKTLSLFKNRSCEMEKFRLRVLIISRTVAYMHCCLNPVVYAFVGVKFRSNFQKIITDIWCSGKKYIYSNRTSRATSEVCVSAVKSSDGSNNNRETSFSA